MRETDIMRPWKLLVLALAGYINQQQQQVIEYLLTENQVLREKIGKKRILLNDNQRRRMAVKGKILGRKLLSKISTIFTPDTILRWHAQLVRKKWDYSNRRKRPGRPPTPKKTLRQVLRIAHENPSWGYDKIEGAMKNLNLDVSATKIGEIFNEHGIEPAPERNRQTTWKTFIQSHLACLGAIDFTTMEVWTRSGLVTYYLLFIMRVGTREVEFAGMTTNPAEAYMLQIARNLTDDHGSFLDDIRYLIMDRDPNFTNKFRKKIQDSGTNVVRLPPRSPNLNPHLERFMLTVKTECLKRMIFIGEHSVRVAVKAYLAHYHCERNHQGLKNKLIQPGKEIRRTSGAVCRRSRLGGLLNYYYRRAA